MRMTNNQLYPNLPKHLEFDNISTHSTISDDKSNNSRYSFSSSRNNLDGFDSISDGIEDHTKLPIVRKQTFQERKKEIERETYESSVRSLQLLDESERAGLATAKELSHQGEQLLRTEAKLDGIDSTLQTSERHIRGIKSVFGGIRNKFSRKKDSVSSALNGSPQSTDPNKCLKSRSEDCLATSSYETLRSKSSCGIQSHRDELFGKKSSPSQERSRSKSQLEHNSDNIETALNKNLDTMSNSLHNLKHLGLGLNKEIKEQNDILDRLATKTTNTDSRVKKQNLDMKRILN